MKNFNKLIYVLNHLQRQFVNNNERKKKQILNVFFLTRNNIITLMIINQNATQHVSGN